MSKIEINGKIYYTFVILIWIIMVMGLASSTEQFIQPVKVGNSVSLVQNCINATYSNITRITDTSGILISIPIAMTKDGDNYDYLYSNNTNLGTHYVYGKCDENGIDTPWAYSYEVTPTGIVQTTAQGLGSAVFLLLMVILTVLFGWIGFKLSESKTLWILGVFFLFLSVIMTVYIVWLGYEYHRSFTGLTDSRTPEIMFYIFMIIVVAGLLASLGLLFLRWKEVVRYVKKELKSKEDDDDEFEELERL